MLTQLCPIKNHPVKVQWFSLVAGNTSQPGAGAAMSRIAQFFR